MKDNSGRAKSRSRGSLWVSSDQNTKKRLKNNTQSFEVILKAHELFYLFKFDNI